LPGNTEKITGEGYSAPFADSVSFSRYLANSEPFVAEYIFNPYYLDYPVIGLTWEQANNFCHWLSDRYNEYCLIAKKYLVLDVDQKDDHNFTTESHIFNQFQGVVDKLQPNFGDPKSSRGFDYIAYVLRPSFHLATRNELEISSAMSLPTPTKGLYNKIDQYTTDGSEFLKPFYKYILPERKGFIFILSQNAEIMPYYLVSQNPKKITIPDTFTEWCLDSYLEKKGNSVNDIYVNYGYSIQNFSKLISIEDPDRSMLKDNLGLMPFIITGENSNREIVIIKAPVSMYNADKTDIPYIFDNSKKTVVNRNGDKFTTFRYAVNAIRKPVKK
jgi:hypothetical protein